MTRVILYARVSQSRDNRDRSVNEQLSDLRKWAERESWEIIGEYRDDGISASRYANGKIRDGWQGVMEHMASGDVHALLVWEASRATRDPEEHYKLERACRTYGVFFGYSNQLYDLRTADGGFHAGLRNLLDAQESAKISERVKRSVDHRAAEGRPHGAVTYGYKRVIDPATGNVVGRDIDSKTAPVVQEVVRRIIVGESLHGIARDLNSRGIATPRGAQWNASQLRRMALRPTYAGLVVHNGEVLRGVSATWPALISEEDHRTVERLLQSPDRTKFRNSVKVKHLGVGLYRCGREGCDGRMRVIHMTGRQTQYNCRTCMKVSRVLKDVDNLVEEVLLTRLEQPDVLELLSEAQDHDAEVQGLMGQRDSLITERQEALGLLETGQLSVLDYATFNRGWEERYDAVMAQIKSSELPELIYTFSAADTRQMWEDADIVTKRQLLDSVLIVTVLPLTRRSGKHEFDPNSIRVEFKAY